MSRITDEITAAAKAAGVKPEAALKLLEDKAFVAKANDVEGVYVHAGAGVIAPIKDAVEELVPIEVRNQTAHDRVTYDHVMSRKAARGATPELPEAAPASLSTPDYLAWRKAQKRQLRGA